MMMQSLIPFLLSAVAQSKTKTTGRSSKIMGMRPSIMFIGLAGTAAFLLLLVLGLSIALGVAHLPASKPERCDEIKINGDKLIACLGTNAKGIQCFYDQEANDAAGGCIEAEDCSKVPALIGFFPNCLLAKNKKLQSCVPDSSKAKCEQADKCKKFTFDEDAEFNCAEARVAGGKETCVSDGETACKQASKCEDIKNLVGVDSAKIKTCTDARVESNKECVLAGDRAKCKDIIYTHSKCEDIKNLVDVGSAKIKTCTDARVESRKKCVLAGDGTKCTDLVVE